MEQPNTPIGQLSQQMAQGVPALDQNTVGSPNFDPSLQPPMPSAMPQGSPMDAIHRAFARRGKPVPAHLQAPQAPQAQPQQPDASGQVTLPIQDENPQQPGTQVQPSEAELLIKAITKRLDHHNKVTEKLVDSFLMNDWKNPGANDEARANKQFGQGLRNGGGLTSLEQVSPNKFVDNRPSINQ